MKILQLCCFSNLWQPGHIVESVDLKLQTDVLYLPQDYGKKFDLVCAAPPCDQFTKANSSNWVVYPDQFIRIAKHCFDICRSTGALWFLENPPGRIETFIPALTKFRILTWSGSLTNKEYVLYSNFLIMPLFVPRYGKANIPRSKVLREVWQKDLIQTIESSLHHCAL